MKINIKDKEKVQNTIDEVEKGCSARLFDIDRIPQTTRLAEIKLSQLRIPQKLWTGCIIYFDPPRVANSYRGWPEGTFIQIERFPSGWFVTQINRKLTGKCAYGSEGKEILVLTEEAKKTIPDVYPL